MIECRWAHKATEAEIVREGASPLSVSGKGERVQTTAPLGCALRHVVLTAFRRPPAVAPAAAVLGVGSGEAEHRV